MSINVNTLPALSTSSQLSAATANATLNTTASKLVCLNSGATDLNYKPWIRAFGMVSYNGNSSATTIAAIGTPVVISNALYQLGSASVNFTTSNNSRLVCGVSGTYFLCGAASVQAGANNQVVAVLFAVNGTVQLSTQQQSAVSPALPQNVHLNSVLNLNVGDYVELYIQNNTAVNNLTVLSSTLTATALN